MAISELIILVAGVALSCVGVIVVRRLIPQEKLTENNDYAGFTYGILGLIYGIYLAFTVVVVWQQYEDAEDQVMQEVAALGALWHEVEAFDGPVRTKMRRDLIAYARFVLDDEWPRMAPGLPHAEAPPLDRLWHNFKTIVPDGDDQRQLAFYNETLTSLREFGAARRMRLLSSTASLPRSMWYLLVLGAAGTIVFTWFYGTHYLSLQIGVTTFLSVVIIYSVLLVSMLEHPFGGTVSVSKRPFQELLRNFEQRLHTEADVPAVDVEPPVADEAEQR